MSSLAVHFFIFSWFFMFCLFFRFFIFLFFRFFVFFFCILFSIFSIFHFSFLSYFSYCLVFFVFSFFLHVVHFLLPSSWGSTGTPPLPGTIPETSLFSHKNLNFQARFWVREEERRRKKKKEERADRNKSPSTIARTKTVCCSRAWIPSLRQEKTNPAALVSLLFPFPLYSM